MLNGAYSEKLTIAANQNLKEKAYWLEKLSGEPERTAFLYDYRFARTVPGETGGEKETQTAAFTGETFQLLMKLSNGSDARLHMILTTALAALLHKYTGSTDIIVGTPIYKQEAGDGFINTVLALRTAPEGNMTFKDLLLQVRKTIVEAVENQNYPIEILADQIDLPFTPGCFPLFDAAVLVENVQPAEYLRPVYEHINMIFAFKKTGESIHAAVEYNPSLYRESSVKRIIRHYTCLLEQVIADVNLHLSQTGILSAEEKKQVVEDFNRTETGAAGDRLLHRLFEEQAAAAPGNIALVGESLCRRGHGPIQLTYGELNERADGLARLLREKGVDAGTQNSIVGIMVGPSIEMMVGLMAILKAGGAYLPIDPNSPGERIDYMLADSSAKVLLATGDFTGKIAFEKEIIYLDNDTAAASLQGTGASLTGTAASGDIAYIIYTSGTTGKPKGVMVEHRNVTAYLHAFYREFDIKSTDTVIQLAAFTFDVFVEEVFPVLLKGGKVVVPNVAQRMDMTALFLEMIRHRVNIVDCTPMLLNELNKLDFTGSGLENRGTAYTFISGGDVLKEEYVDNLSRIGTVYNTYGPTETTVCASYYRYPGKTPHPGTLSSVPIGTPISDYKIFILDADGNPLPIGVPGELCVSGPGVTRGYLNNPELTAERYNRSYKTYRSYKTGDLARWLPAGDLEFLGRIDNQVKIRGFRVELGEIENRLLGHKDIKEAVVLAKNAENGDGEKYICAYIVPGTPAAEAQAPQTGHQWAAELKEYLSGILPEYMVPGYFVRLARIPVTSNGKVDRKSLLALKETRVQLRAAFVAPRTDMEKAIAGIWEEVLGLEEAGVHDNFFDLGGNSLDIIKVNSKLETRLERSNPVIKLFKYPTIGTLAHYLEHGENEEDFTGDSEKVTEQKDRGKNRLKERTRRRKTDLRSNV